MNREEKGAVIEEITDQIREAEAVFAVDYRGITVGQVSELRTTLRDSDTRFRVVKNSLTERAAGQAGVDFGDVLEGPTAFAFVRGDAAQAAKVIADFGRRSGLLAFKGGVLNGQPVSVDQVQAIARLPSREVLIGQFVGTVAAPLSGLARTLNALIGGLAIALGQVQEQGLVGGGGAPAVSDTPASDGPAASEPEPAATTSPDEPPAEAPATDATT